MSLKTYEFYILFFFFLPKVHIFKCVIYMYNVICSKFCIWYHPIKMRKRQFWPKFTLKTVFKQTNVYNSYFVTFILGKVLGNSSKWKCKDWDRREKWWKPRGHPRGSARPCPEPMNEIGRWAYTDNAITPTLLLLYALFRCFSLMFCMIWIKPLIWLCMTGVVPWPAVWDGTVSSPAADPYHCPGRRYRGPHM